MTKNMHPEAIFVQLHTYCNSECINCPFEFTYNSIHTNGRMNDSTWRKILSDIIEMNYSGQVGFYLHHEPLIDKTLYEKIKDINSQTKAYVVLSTNGQLLTEENVNKLIEAKPQKIHLNINSGNKQEYESSMKGLNYETTITNCRKFIDKAKGIIDIEINCPVIEGFDVASLKQIFPDVKVNLDYWANSRGGLLPEFFHEEKGSRFKTDNYCNQPSQNFNILFDGSTIACCMDWMHESKKDFLNINNSSIVEVYNEIKKLETQFIDGDYSKYKMCKACSKEMGFYIKENKLKILITNHQLLDLTGSEIYTYTLAKLLVEKGHEVLIYTKYADKILTLFESIGVKVTTKIDEIKNINFDVAHVHHNIMAIEIRYYFPELPIVFLSHGVIPFLEQPPVIELGISKFVAVSEEVKNNLISNGISSDNVEIIRNIIDPEIFYPKSEINTKPQNALVITNKMNLEVEQTIKEACKWLNIEVQFIGRRFKDVSPLEMGNYINQSDLVFSLGRGIVETMMCGRVPIVFDRNGGDGIVTSKNIATFMLKNFSGRTNNKMFNTQELISEIEKYNKNDIAELLEIAKQNFGHTNVDKLINIYNNAIKNNNAVKLDGLNKNIAETIFNTVIETTRYNEVMNERKNNNINKENNLEKLLAESENYILEEKFENAEIVLTKILSEIDSESIDAANNLVVAWLMQKKYEEAIDLLSQILEKNPNDEIALDNLKFINDILNNQQNEMHDQIHFNSDNSTSVSIIIPVFNKIELTLQCLNSLNEINSQNIFEVIVVDNNSTDGTNEILNKVKDSLKYELKIIQNSSNLGFAKANNIGIKSAKYDNILFLNNDTIAEIDFLNKPVEILNSKNIGAVGIKLLYPDRLIQHAGLAFGGNKLAQHIFNFYPSHYPPANFSKEVSAITGACFFIKKSLFEKLGGFDEAFINGQEDIDLCMKIKSLGLKIWYSPDAWIYHLESQSANRLEKAFQNRQLFLKRWENYIVPDVNLFFDEIKKISSIKSINSKYDMPDKINFAIKIGVPDRTYKNWGDIYYANSLANALKAKGHNAVIHYLEEWNQLDEAIHVVIHIKGLSNYELKPNNVNIIWIINHPELHKIEELNQYDLIFAASKKYYDQISKKVSVPIFYLPQATEKEHFNKRNNVEKEFDVLFIGNNYESKNNKCRQIISDVLETKINCNLKIFGENWDGFVDPKYIGGNFVEWEKIPELYSKAKIVLNDHQQSMRENGFVNNRTFDVAQTGTLQISNYVEGLVEFGIESYNSIDELRDKLKFYLNEEKQRILKAEDNFNKTESCTFENRAAEIILRINEIKNNKSKYECCNICGYQGSDFLNMGVREKVRCPNCNSLERQRALWFLLKRDHVIEPGKKVLEIAPLNNLVFRKYFEENGCKYICIDKWKSGNPLDKRDTSWIDFEMDVCDLKFENETFDLIIMQHVIEEVPDDRKAFSEISRVLKKDGIAILEIPHDKWLRKTIEYDSPQKFGNVRQYGVDFYNRTGEYFKTQFEEIIDGVTFSVFSKSEIQTKLNFPVLLDHPSYQPENFSNRFQNAIELLSKKGFTSLTTYQVENLLYKNVNYKKPYWITLDDGTEADINSAMPILSNTQSVATSFLIPNKLNDSIIDQWKNSANKRILDIQNHSLNHRQTFISNKLIDVYKGEYKHVNLVEVETKKGYPIFEYSSNLANKSFIPNKEVIDFCLEYYLKNNLDELGIEKYISSLKNELNEKFGNDLGQFENDEEFNKRIESEINNSYKILSENFNKSIFAFSFPWGLYNQESLKKASENHTLITRVLPSQINHNYNPLEIDRIDIPSSAFKELENSLYRSSSWEKLEYKNDPKVCVLMTTFNRRQNLADAIQSVVNQTYKDWNLILVNDGGEDVADIVKLFNDPRIQYFSNENKGKAAALNFAIQNSKSKYIAYLDDDDQYLPNHLEVLITYLDVHTEHQFVYSIAEEVSLVENNHQWHEVESTIRYAKQVDAKMLRLMNHIPNLCAVHTRSLFAKAGLYDESLNVLIDWDMYRRLAQISNPKFLNAVTARYFRKRSKGNTAKNQMTGLYFTDPVKYYNNRLKITSKDLSIEKNEEKTCIIIEINNINKSDARFFIAKYDNFRKMFNVELLLVISCKIDIELLESIIYAERVGGLVIFGNNNSKTKINIEPYLLKSNCSKNIFFDRLEKLTKLNIENSILSNNELVHFSETYKQQNSNNHYKKLNFKSEHLVSIIIPTFNNWHLTEECIKSIYSAKDKTKFEVIIVDNNSTDCTKEKLLGTSKKYSNLKVIYNEENLGFSKANNIGAKNAEGDLLLFLNNDTSVKSNWLDEMVKTIDDNKVGIVGAKLLYPGKNEIQHAGIVIYDKPHKIFPLHIFQNEAEDFRNANFIKEYQAVTGACLLIKKNLFELAEGFDEAFVNGYEDVDLCFKIREKGYKVIYNPKSVVIHHESKSEGRFKYVEENVNLLHQKWENKIKRDEIKNLVKPEVSIIIPVYNQLELTKKCIESIELNTYSNYELIIVNNASTDGTKKYLEKLSYVKCINNAENLGYPKAINQGIKIAEGKDIVLLNNDTIVTDGWLERLIMIKNSNQNVGVVGIYSNAISGTQIDKEYKCKTLNEMNNYAKQISESRKYAWIKYPRVAFVCVLINGELINKIGGLDEIYSPGNYEDDDFCLRAQIAGYQSYIATDVFIYHYGSVSFKANGENSYAERIEANKKKFVNKWGNTPEGIWLNGEPYKNHSIRYPLSSDKYILSVQNLFKNIEDGEYDSAIINVKSAIDNFDNSNRIGFEKITKDELLNIAGNLALAKNDLELAKEYFEKQLESSPNSSKACFGLGEVFNLAELYEEAKTMLEWAVVNDNENQNAKAKLYEVNKKLNLPENHNSLLEECTLIERM